jgi:hypothetical protein
MTVDEVLEKAIKDYPIGTKFIGFDYQGNKIDKVLTIDREIICYKDRVGILAYGHGTYYCFYKNKFAKIIDKPKFNTNYKYLIRILKKYKIK